MMNVTCTATPGCQQPAIASIALRVLTQKAGREHPLVMIFVEKVACLLCMATLQPSDLLTPQQWSNVITALGTIDHLPTIAQDEAQVVFEPLP
jgi:hypothetical protein